MRKTAKIIGINLLITLVAGLGIFYVQLPALNLQNPGFYSYIFTLSAIYCVLTVLTMGIHKAQTGRELWTLLRRSCAGPVILCGALIVLFLVGGLISSPILRAGSYQELLTVTDGDFIEEVHEISFDHIPMLDENSAKKLGDRKMGELADMVSQFEVADDYTQINYKGRPVRVTPLIYGDLVKWVNNRGKGLPAYIIIDMVNQNVEVVRLEEGMKYSTAEHFGRNLYRHLRFSYPSYMFDTATFEIDESGHPYWVCPRIVKRIGLFGGTDIQGAVLVDAVTGESEYYTDVPTWVDRVYSAQLIVAQYDYHGLYVNGFLNSLFGQKDVTITTDGYNYIAINDDVYMYTGITSVGGDESNIGFILANQRTKDTRYYAIAGAEEYSAKASAEGIVQHLQYEATFPLLLNISDQPTYFMALKDSAGLVKMYAMVNVRQYQLVASGVTVAECERNYRQLLAQTGLSDGGAAATEISGTVADLRTAVIEGTTRVYIRLTGEDFFYYLDVNQAETAILLSVGDRVTLQTSADEGQLRRAFSIE